MNYADIKVIDVQDGTGMRTSIYVSGCHFHCKGCHNEVAWDFNYGKEFTQETLDYVVSLVAPSYINGLSILGGEPMELVNQKGLLPLVKKVKEMYPNKTIWCYTGYRFDKDILEDMYEKYDFTRELLKYIDIMVDGEFVEEKKIIDLKFRGSTNQKKVDVQESLKQGKLVQLKFGDESRYEKEEKPKVLKMIEYAPEDVLVSPFVPEAIKEDTVEEIPTINIKPVEEKIAAKNIGNNDNNNLV